MSSALAYESEIDPATLPVDMPQLQFFLTPTQLAFTECSATFPILIGPEGEGKCLRFGTVVMMADGTTKPVQEIHVGDSLMGPDSQPRLVLSLARGHEEMVEIVPMKGEPWGCNLSHLLALKRGPNGHKKSGRRKSPGKIGEVVVLPVHRYLEQSRTFKTQHYLYRVPVEFPEQALPIDPYWLGLWLGDGDSDQPILTSADAPIQDYLRAFAASHHLRLVEQHDPIRCARFYFRAIPGRTNTLLQALRTENLLKNKHIPGLYQRSSRAQRLSLLAGLIDTDGWVNRTGYQLIFKHEQLARDVAHIARTLGFAAMVKPRTKRIRSRSFEGTYYHVNIDGACHEIPVILKRKMVPVRRHRKDVLRTHIRTITCHGVGEYYGFTLDGDGLFLLGDCTVTHNTHTAIAAMFRHAKRCEGLLTVPSTGQTRDMMGAIIRDTSVNLRRHTVRSIEKICGNAVEIREFKKVFALKASGITCDLFGMDNTASASRIQGGEYDFIWLEEPAPIIHSGNGGMDVSVWEQAQRRIRGGLTPKRLQVTMNPSSNDHWCYKCFIQFPDPECRVFRIKKGENPFLSKADRDRRARAFANRPDLAKRYDEGEFGAVFPGIAITPDFNERLHVHHDHNGHPLFLLPMPGVECIRMWDGGLNPTCVIVQVMPSGHIHLLDAVVGENMGMRQMIRTRLKKVLARPRYEKIFKWRDIGDPSLDTRDPSDSDNRPSLVIQEELSQPGRQAFFEKGVMAWETRREALREMFARNIDGSPMVRVNPRPTEGESCNVIMMVLGGGYQYPVTPGGIVSRDGPLKNKWSHPGDALSHGMPLVLFPTQAPVGPNNSQAQQVQRERTRGYAVR